MHSVTSARATLDAIKAQKRGKLEVKTLQEYHAMVKQSTGQLRAVKG
jgi:methionine synthase II (cobalamin-independent)